MKKILFVLLLLLNGACFSQTTVSESYKFVSLDGLNDTHQALAGRPIETNRMITLNCLDSKNKTQKIALYFTATENREVVKQNPGTMFINLPLNEYDSYYTKMEQIFIKKELRGAVNIYLISGTNMATFYYYLLNN